MPFSQVSSALAFLALLVRLSPDGVTRCAVLPQQPSCNISLLPIHHSISSIGGAVSISGPLMGTSAMLAGTPGVCPTTGRPIFTLGLQVCAACPGATLFRVCPHHSLLTRTCPSRAQLPVPPLHVQSRPSDANPISAPVVSASAPASATGQAMSLSQAFAAHMSKKREGLDSTPDAAAKRQKVVEESAARAGSAREATTMGTPQSLQQMEDEKLAAGAADDACIAIGEVSDALNLTQGRWTLEQGLCRLRAIVQVCRSAIRCKCPSRRLLAKTGSRIKSIMQPA